jgi:flagellar protein FlgJ
MGIELAQVYTDFSGLDSLKAKARKDKDAALDEVARQFESLFMQMMLKSMRKAGFGGGLMDNKNTEFYRDMYDQQIAMDLSKQRGMGLAEVIKRQLDGLHPGTVTGRDFASYRNQIVARPESQVVQPGEQAAGSGSVQDGAGPVPDGTPESFIDALRPAAEKAAAQLNLPPEALLAQAALETGWGKYVMRQADGSSSHNLFGIKADERWSGDKVQVSTLEYRDGVAMRTRADFRAYDSWEESFDDYVQFVRDNPRYAEALQAGSDTGAYFDRLQKAGYATDPAYAEKINRILDEGPLSAAARPGRGA